MKKLLLIFFALGLCSACDEVKNKSTTDGDIVWIGNGMVQSHGVIADFVSETGAVYSKVLTGDESLPVVQKQDTGEEVPVYLRWSQKKDEDAEESLLELQSVSSNPVAQSLNTLGKLFEQSENGQLDRRRDLESLDLMLGTRPMALGDKAFVYLNSSSQLVHQLEGQITVVASMSSDFLVSSKPGVIASLDPALQKWSFLLQDSSGVWTSAFEVATSWLFLGDDDRFYFFNLEEVGDLPSRSIHALSFEERSPQFEFVAQAPESWIVSSIEEGLGQTAAQSLRVTDPEGQEHIVGLSQNGFEILNDESTDRSANTLHVSSDGDLFLTKSPGVERRSDLRLCRLASWQTQAPGVEDLDCEELKLPKQLYVHDAVLGPEQRVYVVAKFELQPIEGEVDLEFSPQLLVFELSSDDGQFKLVSQRELEAEVYSLRWLNAAQDESLRLDAKTDSPKIDLPQ
jgi:hypothetical protein